MRRGLQLLRAFWSLTWGLLWVAVLHHVWRRGRPPGVRWVIGGHRGRHLGDNSAALEAEARKRGVDITWIANPDLAPRLRAQGIRVLCRQSWAARRAISQASVLIYSHGEDDLDLQLILLRGFTATRIYLNHSLHLLKTGGVLDPSIQSAWWPVRAFRTWLVTRWDFMLPASEKERDYLRECYPMNPLPEKPALLAGAAHLDSWKSEVSKDPKKRIYWFPTFRESSAEQRQLVDMTERVTSSPRLREWLIEAGYEFFIGAHINQRRASAPLQPPFYSAPLSRLSEDVRESEVLISDYSGLMFSFLLLERPVILFAFDLESYSKRRNFHRDYRSLSFALHVSTADELIDALTEVKWRDEALQDAAKKERALCLPPSSPSYAAKSFEAVAKLADSSPN